MSETAVGDRAGLHPDVLRQIERLKGVVAAGGAPLDQPVMTPAGERRVPAVIRALLSIRWPDGQVLCTRDEFAHRTHLSGPFEIEAGQVAGPGAWLGIGFSDGQYFLAVDLDGYGSDDPLVHRIDHEGEPSRPPGRPASAFLAGLTIHRSPAPRARFPRACAAGDLAIVQETLARGRVSLGPLGKSGLTPLHLACISRSVDVVQALLDAGSDPNARIERKVSRLGTYLDRDRHATGRPLWPGERPLYTALADVPRLGPTIVPDLVRALLRAGADPGAADRLGRTPLHAAAGEWEGAEVVRLLLEAGADPNAVSEPDGPPLLDALRYSDQRLAVLLDAGANPCLPSGITSYGVIGVTPLHQGALRGSPDTMRVLLAHAPDVDVRTTAGVTPLHCAVAHGTPQVVQVLIEAGADPTARLDEPAALQPGLRAPTPRAIAHELGRSDIAAVLDATGE